MRLAAVLLSEVSLWEVSCDWLSQARILCGEFVQDLFEPLRRVPECQTLIQREPGAFLPSLRWMRKGRCSSGLCG